tara:strand:+ start:53 stop:814 length:762 start_codon:yes stop_codon:yes gene_type:complete
MSKAIKIEFVSRIKGVADIYPVLKASQYKRKWVDVALKDYKEHHQEMKTKTHLMRCPGIFSLLNEGYILTTWHDVIITTKKGEEGFSWQVPMNESDNKEMFDVAPIDAQYESITKWFPKNERQTNTFVKINSPINVIAPKGIRLLIAPIPYPDQFDFECASGILDPSESTELNAQLKWFKEDGEVLIKAGTPIAHLIPICNSKTKIEIVNRDANKKELMFMKTIMNLNAFTFDESIHKFKKKIKNMYANYFLE